MLIKIPRGWEIPERLVTPEHVYLDRRKFLTSAVALGGIAGLLPGVGARANASPDPSSPTDTEAGAADGPGAGALVRPRVSTTEITSSPAARESIAPGPV